MDPYTVLGISSGFTFKDLSEAYRAVARAASGRDAETSLLRAASAFEVLSRANVGGARARTLTSKTPPRSRLAVPLKRLKRALQGLERSVLQRKLQELSKELRMELLKYMELTSISGHNPSSPLKLGACGLQRNRQGLFRAKMNLEHISLYSSYTANELAVEHHIFLVRLRHLVTSGLKRGLEIAEAFQEAFGVLEKLDLSGCPVDHFPSQQTSFSSFLHQQGIRTYLNIRAARWLGSTHVTSPVLPFTQILDLRKRLLMAREQGWDAFRAEWISMMQHVGLSRVRKRVGHPAGIVELAQSKMHKTARFRRPLKPLKLRASERPELKLCRAVKAAEAALAKLVRLKRKRKAQHPRSLPRLSFRGAHTIN